MVQPYFISNKDVMIIRKKENKEPKLITKKEYIHNYINDYIYSNLNTIAHYLKENGYYKTSISIVDYCDEIAQEIQRFFESKGYIVWLKENKNPNRKWVSYWIEIVVNRIV